MSDKVDQAQLMRFLDIEKEILELERKNVLKNYEVRKKAADDVDCTVKSTRITLKQLTDAAAKEKDDVDKLKQLSIKDMFKDEASYNAKMTQEQEEYLEAKGQEESCKLLLEGLEKQMKELQDKADEIKEPADRLKALYDERDTLLSDIFGGEYGSDLENQLEAKYDSLIERKQRISVAKYKWTQAKVLLTEAVKQMSHAVQKWVDLKTIQSQNMQLKYSAATEVRNNLIAAMQNINSTQRYLSTIEFPYCKPEEMHTLNRAINNIYTDMVDLHRHEHACQCYTVTYRRAGALLQWFDNVIKDTILKDLEKVSKEAKDIEQKLRAERIKLIKEKVAESGGDTSAINEADMVPGLKGMTDQTQLSEEDMDMKGIGITQPAEVGPEHGIPNVQMQEPCAPTPLPLSEIAPVPSEADLFGNISELKEKHKKHEEEFQKTQDLNRARMQQGLQSKLAQRRHCKR